MSWVGSGTRSATAMGRRSPSPPARRSRLVAPATATAIATAPAADVLPRGRRLALVGDAGKVADLRIVVVVGHAHRARPGLLVGKPGRHGALCVHGPGVPSPPCSSRS